LEKRNLKAFSNISKFSLLSAFFVLLAFQLAHAQSDVQAKDSVGSINVDSVWREKSFISRATSIPPFQSKPRLIAVTATYAAAWTGTIIALNEIWYKDFPKSKFHAFDDSREWLQVDKVGHTFSAYRLSLGYSSVLQWSGMSKRKSVYLGALSGVLSHSVIEILDGISAKWGFSWSDMGANILGSGMYAGQYAMWGEQRVLFKFSRQNTTYPEGMLRNRANDLYGTSPFSSIFKDYNAQTYWLSSNLRAFLPKSKLPKWLNLAVGYGADGMYGGFENKWTDSETGISYNRSDVARLRQFYLSPDIDLSRIKTKSKYLNALFTAFNLKIPMPTLEIRSNGKVKFHGLFY